MPESALKRGADDNPNNSDSDQPDQKRQKIESTNNTMGKNMKCTICQEEFNTEADKDVIDFLPCICAFHTECIDGWINEKATCPNCNTPVYVNTHEQLESYNELRNRYERAQAQESNFFHRVSAGAYDNVGAYAPHNIEINATNLQALDVLLERHRQDVNATNANNTIRNIGPMTFAISGEMWDRAINDDDDSDDFDESDMPANNEITESAHARNTQNSMISIVHNRLRNERARSLVNNSLELPPNPPYLIRSRSPSIEFVNHIASRPIQFVRSRAISPMLYGSLDRSTEVDLDLSGLTEFAGNYDANAIVAPSTSEVIAMANQQNVSFGPVEIINSDNGNSGEINSDTVDPNRVAIHLQVPAINASAVLESGGYPDLELGLNRPIVVNPTPNNSEESDVESSD
jgi:hypothetical protein